MPIPKRSPRYTRYVVDVLNTDPKATNTTHYIKAHYGVVQTVDCPTYLDNVLVDGCHVSIQVDVYGKRAAKRVKDGR